MCMLIFTMDKNRVFLNHVSKWPDYFYSIWNLQQGNRNKIIKKNNCQFLVSVKN